MTDLRERWLSPTWLSLLAQFIRFGCVGVVGFLADTATVYGLRGVAGLYGAGLAAYVVAATVTWALNRAWTFRAASRAEPLARQWARFLSANAVGFALNRGTYAALVASVPAAAAQPVIATAAGAIAGMLVNFRLSRRLVFGV